MESRRRVHHRPIVSALLPLVLGVALLVLPPDSAWAIYIETPAPGHQVGAAVTLIDLPPPGPILAGGALSPRAGRVTLQPGAGGAVLFLPGAASGPRGCFGGHNPVIAGVICGFTDNVVAPFIGWHGEFLVHNPNAGIVAFNAAFFDGYGNVYAGPAVLGPGSSLYVDMHTADGSLPHFSEGGVTFVWAASTVQTQLDVTFTVSEGVLLGDGVAPCPVRAVAPGPLPIAEGLFGCAFTFFSDPNDSWAAGADDPNLPAFSIMDPAVRTDFPDIFPDPALVPAPAAAWLLALGLAGWLGARRLRRAR